ncbi:cation diffusion facilitator family transporter [Nocardia sp. alder85J]|uniref:cation diffusion facilitator family transporter n=1 Tax=Nocardia sp. alder85J TaxID=2862949 RepID=UPI001CD506D3|nr:cation diffusion facilitator family transporter [Nocardia sp. alder85J]MCX4094911.1 cation diffusion facilitator family transporter [Nocardia sp. alder85J]
MGAAHGSGHAHAGHQHAGHGQGSADSDRRWLAGALVAIVLFMIGEVIAGVIAGSLALLSDAAHMLTDAASIALALGAMRLAARPASGRMTFGWRRVEILSAQANGLTLIGLGIWLAVEAVRRLIHPPAVTGGLVLGVALVGIVVNITATWMISRANRSSLNVEGAFQHILTDLFAFIATAVAGLVMWLTGFARADSLATLVVVVLMLRAGIELVRAANRIFLEAAPADLDPNEIGRAMAARDGVVEVHDLHIWEITSGTPALSAHILVEPGHDCHAVRADLAHWLADTHHIGHATLQVDHARAALIQLGAAADPHNGDLHCGPDTHDGDAPDEHCGDAHGPAHRRPETAAGH